jgi:hypothetical protein
MAGGIWSPRTPHRSLAGGRVNFYDAAQPARSHGIFVIRYAAANWTWRRRFVLARHRTLSYFSIDIASSITGYKKTNA